MAQTMTQTVLGSIKQAHKVTHQNQMIMGRDGRVDVVAFYDGRDGGAVLMAYAKLPTGAVKVVQLGNAWFQPSRAEVPAEVLAL